ncbi:large protein [Dolphin rhabdovirus]|uniref:Replicase n=1 Tax=Dolphin rhabdovirus TaxID=1511639 RepID=A0A068EQH8_9RHAB|nr:large protein [Dolphin rhabdovirus]AID53192.1 large protein [Dolphin rhabdovirus]
MDDFDFNDLIDEIDLPDWLSTDIVSGKPLNSKDYSLNSPLIGDFIDAACEYLRPYPNINPRYEGYIDLFNDVRSAAIENKIVVNDDHKDCHKWLGTHLLSLHDDTRYRKLIQLVNQDCKELKPIIDSFFRIWGLEESGPVEKRINNPWVYHYGGLFLSWHQIVLIMNSKSGEERIKLSKFIKGTLKKNDDKIWSYQGTMTGIGKVIIWADLVLLLNHHLLIDRNFSLMIKDLLIARTQTMMAIIGREDGKYDINTYNTINQIYVLGDHMMRKFGNDCYDALKLIEPMCNLRLADLAHMYRPLIPDFPHFRRHVETSVVDLSHIMSEIYEIFKIIDNIESVEDVLTIFSSFRHWGHPFINYIEGLKKLHDQVTMPKNIDRQYANTLASDLAYLILKKYFENHKHWAVEKDRVGRRCLMREHIMNSTWPTPKQIEDFGDHWHELPLSKIYEIPDLIDPSVIYSDKSHSMNRSEIIQHILEHPLKPIPTRKVLRTLLEKPATDWPSFLKRIDEEGLNEEALVIGLKGKERELKQAGRFFSLMSWELREYFVITEYLIKHHFVPLFKGLTMADDMTEVIKKMLERSQGQGELDYQHVSIANHIDYEKWNNHQRKESNGPVFRVMGQFLGYPSLIERTHEFFEKSLVYYNGRPDLMKVENGVVLNKTDNLVCWNGQAGGLEGLRQKGWSILNLLVIRRESKIRNTRVQTLAQGDNQVICTQYRLQPTRNEDELIYALNQIKDNNAVIMSAIETGVNKLGLIINNDETIQSADFLTYGKVPIFRGNIRGLETKRWSRVTCVTNDQLPSLANVLSSVSTNALTVSHYSVGPTEAIRQYLFFGNFARRLTEQHDPAIRAPIKDVVSKPELLKNPIYKACVLFLDPSIGGVCGMALTRFLMRMFPDPITESLSFWRMLYLDSNVPWVRSLALKAGYPELARNKESNLNKLIENPSALNLRKETSALSVIKNEVKSQLYRDAEKIGNKMISDAIAQSRDEEPYLEAFLASIRPLFPRFLSEFRSASFIGITDSLISLFQNSKTIRNIFRSRYAIQLEERVVKCEVMSISTLIDYVEKETYFEMWICSSSHADLLRFESWGTKVVGATVPHPFEMLKIPKPYSCISCHVDGKLDYITLNVVQGLKDCLLSKGPMPAYLGSKTSETTSILQPWERETKIPIIRRAANLRSAISWFIEPDSNLAKAILNNLESLTGEDWSGMIKGFRRTGSALHRFSSSRISSGGFAAQSPARLTRMMSTTDTFRDIGDDNYDFMFQSLLIFSQMIGGELLKMSETGGVLHFHMNCNHCLRKIDEPKLESSLPYNPVDKSYILNTWKPERTEWSEENVMPDLNEGDWNKISHAEMSFHVGKAQGFLYGDLLMTGNHLSDQSSLFPLSIQWRLKPQEFFDGLIDGLIKAAALSTIHRRNFDHPSKFRSTFFGTLDYIVDQLTLNAPFCNLVRSGPLSIQLSSVPHRIPPSYPLTQSDLGSLARNYLRQRVKFLTKDHNYHPRWNQNWVFADMMSPVLINPFVLSYMCVKLTFSKRWGQHERNKLMVLRNTAQEIRKKITKFKLPVHQSFRYTDQEVRHACKYTLKEDEINQEDPLIWGNELIVGVETIDVMYNRTAELKTTSEVKQRRDPTISGLRLFQFATGSHYKLRAIIYQLNLKYDDFLCGGDGSGGITSALMRYQPFSRCIFNSLLETEDIDLRGSAPSPPSAVKALGKMSQRCVNLNDVWKNPSDLSDQATWEYFHQLKSEHKLNINLMVFDMEVRSNKMSESIETLIKNNLHILEYGGHLIYKTYLSRLFTDRTTILEVIGGYFKKVMLVYTEATSSHSSEVYVLGYKKMTKRALEVYPCWGHLMLISQAHPCFNDDNQELIRAQKLSKMQMFKGVPNRLIPDLETEITTLCLSMGVENGISVILSEEVMIIRDSNPLQSTLYLVMTIHNQILTPTRLKAIPSNNIVQNVLSLLIGFGLILSVYENKSNSYSNLKMCIDQFAPFYINKTTWNVNSGLNKSIRLDNKMALMGQVIRICQKIGMDGKFNLRDLEHRLYLRNKRFSLKKLKEESGFFDYVLGSVRPFGKFLGSADSPEERVSAWRD